MFSRTAVGFPQRGLSCAEVRALVIFGVAVFWCTTARRAAADPEQVLRAESLFRSGKEAFQQGEYATACPRLAESQRLQPAGGTVLALALCYEAWGKNATAWALFQEAEAMARAQGRSDRVAIARQRAAALEAGLSFLTIRLDPAAPSLVEVSLDGLTVAEAALGARTAVDVGAHRIEARHNGRSYFNEEVVLASKQTFELVVPAPRAMGNQALDAAIPAVRSDESRRHEPPQSRVPGPQHSAPLGLRPQTKTRAGADRIVPHVVLGVGLSSLLAAGYFGVRAFQESREVERGCPRDPCNPALEPVHQASRRDAALANWLTGAGVLVTALGAYLSLRGASDGRASSSAVRVAASADGASLGYFESF